MANVIVIGGGPGGSAAATRLAQLGAQVTLVEKELIGGNCVNFNCIPLTGMLASLELFSRMQNAQEMGIETGEVRLNLSRARARVEAIAEEMQLGIQAVLGSYGVKIQTGTAQLEGPETVGSCRHVILSFRSRARFITTRITQMIPIIPAIVNKSIISLLLYFVHYVCSLQILGQHN